MDNPGPKSFGKTISNTTNLRVSFLGHKLLARLFNLYSHSEDIQDDIYEQTINRIVACTDSASAYISLLEELIHDNLHIIARMTPKVLI